MGSYNVSEEERDRIYSRGQFKTVLEEDTRYSEHRPIVIALSKIGVKYIHGIVCHREDDGQVRPNYWVATIDKKHSKIFDGQRWDMIDRYHLYLKEKHDYQDQRERQYRISWGDLETELRKKHGEIMKAWDLEHPEPKDPFQDPA